MSGHLLTNCCRVPFMSNTCGACGQPCESVFRADPLEEEMELERFNNPNPEPMDFPDRPPYERVEYPPRWSDTDAERDNYNELYDDSWHSNEMI